MRAACLLRLQSTFMEKTVYTPSKITDFFNTLFLGKVANLVKQSLIKCICCFRIKQDYIQQESNFPGISLKFCVSDVGLEALLKCQRLRKISMNKNFNHSANHYAYGGKLPIKYYQIDVFPSFADSLEEFYKTDFHFFQNFL